MVILLPSTVNIFLFHSILLLDGNQLVRDIEYWLPVFVRMGSHQALMIADAFVPT